MNTYLIVSETIYNIEKTLDELKKGINNVITYNLDINTLDEVLEEASYFSMFEEDKCLIVKNAKFFLANKKEESNKNKEDINKLLKYLDNENKKTKLIFIVNGKADSKKKIYNLIKDAGNLYNYPNLTKTEMKNELNKIVKSKGYTIDDETLWYIINNLGNFDLCINELNKIMIYYSKEQKILLEDVKQLLSKVIEENNFKLVDSIINKDLSNIFKYLEESKILKTEPNIIISLLYREFKLMLSTLLYEENKYSYSDVLKNLKLAEWQMTKVRGNLRIYNKEEIKEQIVKLSDLDYQSKSGLINKDVILIKYILELCL